MSVPSSNLTVNPGFQQRRSPSPVRIRNSPSPVRNRVRRQNDQAAMSESTAPLIEMLPPQVPPLAGPEIDDIDANAPPLTEPYPGVDDGFFTPPEGTNPNRIPLDPNHTVNIGNGGVNIPMSPGNTIPGPFPYAPGYGPYGPAGPRTEFDFATTAIPGDLESIPDVNVYQHKKTLAQGMMDLALFSANANQLRYVLESSERHPYFYPSVVLISISLVIQVAIGVGLIWNSRYNVKDNKEICVANKINNYTIIGIFLVTTINVFISAFGVASAPVTIVAAAPVVTP